MSKERIFECIKINLADLEKYIVNPSAQAHPVTNWLSLNSQLQLTGLSNFKKALELPNETNIQNLRNENASLLLNDLEKLSKRQELNDERKADILKFDKNFYKEALLPENKRSDQFKNFLNSYADLTVDEHFIEKISAKMLIELGKDELKSINLKKTLLEEQAAYKKKYGEQASKDLETREFIFIKDKAGQVNSITLKELEKSAEIPLSGEQRDFIKNFWQQGSFGSGWIGALPSVIQKSEERILLPQANDRNFILIDVSNGVKVYNRTQIKLTDMNAPEVANNYIHGTLTVNITDLKGATFSPGCASSRPKMEAIITRTNNNFEFNLPRDFLVDKNLEFDKIRQKVMSNSKQGYLNVVVNDNKHSLTLRAINALKNQLGENEAYTAIAGSLIQNKNIQSSKSNESNSFVKKYKIISKELDNDIAQGLLPREAYKHRLAVELYNMNEIGSSKNFERFTGEQISKFSLERTGILDKKECEIVKKSLVSILKPVCKDNEIKILEKNAGSLVREFAEMEGKQMSFGQAWQKFADNTRNVISKILNRETKLEKLINNHPEVFEEIKQKLKNSTSPLATNSLAKINKKHKGREI